MATRAKIAESIGSNLCCGGMLDSPCTVNLGYLKQTRDSETAAQAVFSGVVEILTKCRERDRDGYSTLTAAA